MSRAFKYISAVVGNLSFSDYALMLFLLLYPFNIKLSLISLAFHFILTIRTNYKGFYFSLSKEIWLITACVAFYLLHVISLVYSLNFHNGLKDVETKFGFFVFPVLALIFPRTSSQRKLFINAFVFSFTFASLVCILRSLINYLQSFDASVLFYDQFSFLMHPTYFTMYLATALVFHFYLCYSQERADFFIKSEILKYTIGTVLLTAIFLTSSRAGIIIAVSSAALILSGKMIKAVIVPIKTIFIYGIVSIFLILIILAGSARFSIIFNELSGKSNIENEDKHAPVDENPVGHRLILMKAAYKIAMKHPFGVGAGDVQDVLVEEYKSIGYEKAVIVRYNPHNQYLQTAVALGLPGLFSLLVIFVVLMRSLTSLGSGKLLFFVGFILALNGLFESVFEVQRGVLFLTIILAFIMKIDRNEKKTTA